MLKCIGLGKTVGGRKKQHCEMYPGLYIFLVMQVEFISSFVTRVKGIHKIYS